MTITLTPEEEARLRKQDREEAIAGIRRGLSASDAGRVRPAAEVFAEMKAKLKSRLTNDKAG